MSPTSDTSSCFYGDQGANHTALLRTVLLRADKRVERGVRRGSSLFMRANKIPVALQEVVPSCFPLNVEVTPGIDISKELVITEKKKKKKRKRGLSRDISFRALQDPTPHLLFHHQPHPPSPPPAASLLDAPCYITRTALWQLVFVTGRERECECE